jgi:hypothetical protein
MKNLLVLTVSILTFIGFGQTVMADSQNLAQQEIEVLSGEQGEYMASFFSNPPGSRWISVRCGKSSVCYPPAGYKFRHFNTDIKGSGCEGAQKRRVEQNKDFIKTSRKCSVRGRVFIWPAQYCKGNYKYCS